MSSHVDRVYESIKHGEQVIPHQDFLRAGLMDKGPFYKLYDAIEMQVGRGDNRNSIPVKLALRDWNRITQALEIVFGVRHDD